MRNCLIVLLTVMLLFATAGVSADTIPGGWEMLDVTEPIPEEALAAFSKAMEGFCGVGYEPVALLSKQVVAGMNYLFLCKAAPVVPDPVPFWATVTVYAALDGSAQILSITAIDPYPPLGE